MEQQDTIIHNGLLLTMDREARILPHHSIRIIDGIIQEILPVESSKDDHGIRVINASGSLVMPGFINCHTHAAMTLLRGFADDKPLHEWLSDYIWPAEAVFMNRENIALGTRLAILEMIASGTVMFSDMYFFGDEVARACEEAGMRVLLGEGLLGNHTPHFTTPYQGIDFTETLAEQYKNHSLIEVAYAPHAVYTCPREILSEVALRSEKNHLPVHIHLAETAEEVENCIASTGKHPVDYLDEIGLLDQRLIAAHVVHVEEEHLKLLTHKGVRIAHNPSSNLKLNSGFPPIHKQIQYKIPLGLGTDGAGSNNNLSIPVEMRHTALVDRLLHQNRESDQAFQIVKMATIGGAKVLGADQITGSLEAGKAADLIIIPLDKPHLQPIYNIYSTLVFSLHSSDIDTVMINGKIVMKDRKILTLDEESLLKDLKRVAGDIREKFKMKNHLAY